MKIGVTFPIYSTCAHHRDLINQAIKSIHSSEHEIQMYAVNNRIFQEFAPEISLNAVHLQGKDPQSVASGWNIGIKTAIEDGCEYILVINTDIVLRHDCISRLVAFAEAHQEAVLWSAGEKHDLDNLQILENTDENFSEHPNFSCYMVHKTFIQKMGLFDENLVPAYFEDSDMHARIALTDNKAYCYGGALFYHFGSQTINADPVFRIVMPPLFDKNRMYFERKWGHGVVNEVDEMKKVYWKHPFNNETYDVNYWK